MVFGVFDSVHDGHRELFMQAKKFGDHLVVAVAQDHIVEFLKHRLPERSLAERIEELQDEKLVNQVVLGDAELGTYEVILKHRPDVIALGNVDCDPDLISYLVPGNDKARKSIEWFLNKIEGAIETGLQLRSSDAVAQAAEVAAQAENSSAQKAA